MNKPIFTGACTALVTPFLNGQVNYPMLEQLLKRQMEAGISAVVLCGTTGEAPTLSDCEKLEMIRRAKEYAGSRCKIIAGTGSNDTQHAIALSKAAQEAGADALLVVSPYYNKATDQGLAAHFQAVAQSVHIPVILYNVPSRTGVDIPARVYQHLARIPNIAGVKEASSDITKISAIRACCPDSFRIWSGCDELALPAMALGADGVISVVSNVMPEQTQALALAMLDGDLDTAEALHQALLPLMQALFREVNPIPVKAAMKAIGYDCGSCRLPLTDASKETITILEKWLSEP